MYHWDGYMLLCLPASSPCIVTGKRGGAVCLPKPSGLLLARELLSSEHQISSLFASPCRSRASSSSCGTMAKVWT